MAFMWTGISNSMKQLKSSRYFRFLLIVPFLALLSVGSFQIGRSNGLSADKQDHHNVVASRFRRHLNQTPSVSTLNIVSTGGATYTRWGRTECPSGSDVVYSGIAGGSLFDNFGGGSNYLCLPMDPLWGKYNENVEKGSKLYGAEYEAPSGIDLKHFGGRTAQDHNVPCVVCRSQARTSALMIPARTRCYGDWYTEYTGYLMAGNQAHKGRFEYVCVDESPEGDPAGYRNENGALFYNVEGVCGSLPCPPYIQRREITCAVCTK